MEDEKTKSVFETLNELNVNDKVEKKSNLSYLSWSWAWARVKETYPDAIYEVWKDEKGNPYTFDDSLGFMCYTTVSINGETLEMWLPVMDGANKAMKKVAYTYEVKDWDESKIQNRYVGKEKNVAAASMFDVNKTIMRCLVKNLAMFGLGLYIYSGEDLPEAPEETPEPIRRPTLTIPQFEKMMKLDDVKLAEAIGKVTLNEEQQNIVDLKLKIK